MLLNYIGTSMIHGKMQARHETHHRIFNNKIQYVKDHRIDVVQISDFENFIRQKVQSRRKRLEQENNLDTKSIHHFTRPFEHPFTRNQRSHTTILFGGLTWKHERLMKGTLEGLGYRCEILPTPDVQAFQLGKEYGNNGQCNPTYFLSGNLIKYLKSLKKAGLSKKEILDNYVFFTAGSCGPCRFGMYESEYRLALRNAGFDGFRVLLFQQNEGLNQSKPDTGLKMNLEFFIGVLNATIIGDLINEACYRIRPYEVNPGETNRVLEEVTDHLYRIMKQKCHFRLTNVLDNLLRRFHVSNNVEYIGKFVDQLFGSYYVNALKKAKQRLDTIEIDRTRVKPIVKVTGEFWAQITEGDGNFNMFSFLEREGAQLLVEPITTWVGYLIHHAKQATIDRKGLIKGQNPPQWWEIMKRLRTSKAYLRKLVLLALAGKIIKREYNRMRDTLGLMGSGITDQHKLQQIAHPYYNSRAAGGEGHLEIAKNIYYQNKDLSHMVLSLKPFGCMPSTQSDGVQATVINHYKDIIYLPVETSGEGEINAHSRVQMALADAKIKAEEEFQEVLSETGLTIEKVRVYVEKHPELKRPMYPVPHYKGTIGVAANFIRHVADRMRSEYVMVKQGISSTDKLILTYR